MCIYIYICGNPDALGELRNEAYLLLPLLAHRCVDDHNLRILQDGDVTGCDFSVPCQRGAGCPNARAEQPRELRGTRSGPYQLALS